MYFQLTGRPGHTFAKYRMDGVQLKSRTVAPSERGKERSGEIRSKQWTSQELSRQGTGSPLGLPSPN
ncbi:Uncharacterized protein APZ42_025728 [Daphnia magna]|uniref:Uncharacterized protein n=1 Tax=Daphnia magna TaxID=35525 RepID=A0A162EET5_9CRUS|nr:Uncharacterized protein APZ42_025728 [Daphnia magna]